MANLWEDIKKFVKDGANTAVDRFEEETTLWKIHREISNFKKAVDAQKLQLGAHVYETLKTSPESNLNADEKLTGFLTEIDNLLEKVAEKQNEYDEFKKTAEAKRTHSDSESIPEAEVVTETAEPKPETEPEEPAKATSKKETKKKEPPADSK